jgi:hypothetical protein
MGMQGVIEVDLRAPEPKSTNFESPQGGLRMGVNPNITEGIEHVLVWLSIPYVSLKLNYLRPVAKI